MDNNVKSYIETMKLLMSIGSVEDITDFSVAYDNLQASAFGYLLAKDVVSDENSFGNSVLEPVVEAVKEVYGEPNIGNLYKLITETVV